MPTQLALYGTQRAEVKEQSILRKLRRLEPDAAVPQPARGALCFTAQYKSDNEKHNGCTHGNFREILPAVVIDPDADEERKNCEQNFDGMAREHPFTLAVFSHRIACRRAVYDTQTEQHECQHSDQDSDIDMVMV